MFPYDTVRQSMIGDDDFVAIRGLFECVGLIRKFFWEWNKVRVLIDPRRGNRYDRDDVMLTKDLEEYQPLIGGEFLIRSPHSKRRDAFERAEIRKRTEPPVAVLLECFCGCTDIIDAENREAHLVMTTTCSAV